MAKMKYPFKTKPDSHQIDALKNAIEHGRYGIFFQQRVGKTKVAIDFCGVKSISHKARRVLIICPLSIRSEWGSQLGEHMSVPYRFELYGKTEKKRLEQLKKYKDPEVITFIAVNYDLLISQKNVLKEWDADIIIYDESHLLKNQASKRSKAAFMLSKNTQYVLLLTGTPIPKRWYDIYAQFRAMNSNIFGHTWTAFKKKYCIMGGFMGKEIVGCTDMESISRIMARHSIRVLRKDVFDEPAIENITLRVDLEPKAHKMYKDLKEIYVAELDAEASVTADMATTRLMRLQQFCGGFMKTDDDEIVKISNAKLDMLVDLVSTKAEGGEQVVIFHRFRPEGEEIVKRLRLTGLEVVEFNGSVDEQGRLDARDKFQAGEIDAIVIQIATGAMGITLDKAHINIFYSLDFSLSNFLQARDRVMGRNQLSDVTNYFIAVDKTVDIKVMKTLQKDEDVATQITDRWRWLMED